MNASTSDLAHKAHSDVAALDRAYAKLVTMSWPEQHARTAKVAAAAKLAVEAGRTSRADAALSLIHI